MVSTDRAAFEIVDEKTSDGWNWLRKNCKIPVLQQVDSCFIYNISKHSNYFIILPSNLLYKSIE